MRVHPLALRLGLVVSCGIISCSGEQFAALGDAGAPLNNGESSAAQSNGDSDTAGENPTNNNGSNVPDDDAVPSDDDDTIPGDDDVPGVVADDDPPANSEDPANTDTPEGPDDDDLGPEGTGGTGEGGSGGSVVPVSDEPEPGVEGGTGGSDEPVNTGGSGGDEPVGTGGGGDTPNQCVYALEVGNPDWPSFEQRDNCAVCVHESCEFHQYVCGAFLDPCGTEQVCGEPPVNFGTSGSCPADRPVMWGCSADGYDERFPMPDPECTPFESGTPGMADHRRRACCPGRVLEAMPWDTGADLEPFAPVIDRDCEALVTFYLDHDSDSYGGPISVESCYPPDSIVPKEGERFLSGLWVTQGGDCYDDNAATNPSQTAPLTTNYAPPWLPIPLYDHNCDGVEVGWDATPAWEGVPQNCMVDPVGNCSGGGWNLLTTRTPSGYPGISDSCGAIGIACLSHAAGAGCYTMGSGQTVACL